jgi:hypothetical protein
MTTLATNHSTRREQQLRVEALLAQLAEQRREMYRLKAGGAQYAGLRDLKRDYRAVQHDLSAVLDAGAPLLAA